MKKSILTAGALLALAAILALPTATPRAADLAVVVQVAPSTLLLGSVQSGRVTVHAEIPYSSVDAGSVTLDGIPASSTFADSRGELVAKFPEDAVKARVSPPSATLTLSGLTRLGETFAGSDEVRVRDR